jgi:hypothetical protein
MRRDRTDHPLRLGEREKGVVLIAVLWICALVMWFTLQIGVMSRMQGEEQVHLFRRSQALYLAISGCYEALARMGQAPPSVLERRPELVWQPDGTEHLLNYQTGEVLVTIESEGRKVNVNLVTPDQLRTVLESAGVGDKITERLADVICDFIDVDDMVRLHGMEAAGYQSSGLLNRPFNGPLSSVDQLLLIPGISEELLYGYMRGGSGAGERASGAASGPMVPGKSSLFQMLTVYGRNTTLPQPILDEVLEERIIPWENGGIYRIFSTGKAYNGPPAVTICLIVRLAPQSKQGYEVLHRKIM